jgi:hypothetical protein
MEGTVAAEERCWVAIFEEIHEVPGGEEDQASDQARMVAVK